MSRFDILSFYTAMVKVRSQLTNDRRPFVPDFDQNNGTVGFVPWGDNILSARLYMP